jgi:hypothetical protein
MNTCGSVILSEPRNDSEVTTDLLYALSEPEADSQRTPSDEVEAGSPLTL